MTGLYKLKKKKRAAAVIGRVVLTLVIAAVLIVSGYIAWLTVRAYRPQAEETLKVQKVAADGETGTDLTVMTWNIGYGALGEEADFFLDGGTHVRSYTLEGVEDNVGGIIGEIKAIDPDVLFLQEVDEDSKMSWFVNERQEITDALDGYDSTFAYTYKTDYIALPLPVTIGKEQTGMMMFSRYPMQEATRVALPDAYSWPVNTAYLKRALVVSRIDLEGTTRQLVLVNLHLEAYDSGEAKAEQTAILRDLLYQEIEAGNYVIAGGDFNQTFSDADISAYPVLSEDYWQPGVLDVSNFDDRVTFFMDTSNPTCRSLDKPLAGADADNFQYYCVDGFIVSSNVDVISVRTQNISFQNSDHNPVVLKVKLEESKS